MKEEDGMNRRRSTSKWLVGAALLATWAGSTQSALAQSYPFNGDQSLNFVGNQTTFVAPGRRAGPTLNEGGIGQILWGQYYDVRPYTEADGTTESTQFVNLAIINTYRKLTNNPAQSGNWGGQLVRVRFRESKTSREVLDFDIVLSCAEVWTARVSLPTEDGLPELFSNDQIVDYNASDFNNGILVTDKIKVVTGGDTIPFLNNTPLPPGLNAKDIQRGYIEVFGMETLPCEPVDATTINSPPVKSVKYDPTKTNTWLRSTPQNSGPWGRGFTPGDVLAGEVFIVRPEVGTSYNYNMTAISRFNVAPNFSFADGFNTTDFPNPKNGCVGPDNSGGFYFEGIPLQPDGMSNCTNQLDLQLSKRRLVVPFDIDPTTLGRTHVVFTFPTKLHHCITLPSPASPPFECSSTGELIGYQAYDRIETNLCVGGQSSVSPQPDQPGCTFRAPREVTILQIRQRDGSTSPRADVAIFVPNTVGAGWVDFDLYGPSAHGKSGLSPTLVDFLGAGYTLFRGLPVLPLVLQDYINLNAEGSKGGFFGNNVEAIHEVYRS